MAPASQAVEFPELFEGPEKTLTLCFKSRRVAAKSLRLIPQEAWEKVLKHAKCEILSVVESQPVELQAKSKKDRVLSTKGVTGYLLSESSLFVADTTLTLKTCGTTTPLAALEPLLDLAVPTWRQKEPEQFLKFATFTRLNYMRPGEQLEPHTSWAQEVEQLNQHFQGEDVHLGSDATSSQHVYVANYLRKDDIVDVFSTQVVLTGLEIEESMRRYAGGDGYTAADYTPLKTAWEQLHGDENRSIAANARLDERFYEPIGYSSNAVFGKHYTTMHVTPQAKCSYISAETSMPLTREARQRFVCGAKDLCTADALSVTEFSLCPKLFSGGAAPAIPNFTLRMSSQTVTAGFACAHHHFQRTLPTPSWLGSASPLIAASSTPTSAPGSPVFLDEEVSEQLAEAAAALDPLPVASVEVPVIKAHDVKHATVLAAELFLGSSEHNLQKDIPIALVDTAVLKSQAKIWHQLLPRVEPFYAVKCNPHPSIVQTLWSIWQEQGTGGFDCASPSEMKLVLPLGVNPAEQIVYANPCKQISAVEFAQQVGVRRLVFDNAAELQKLANTYPSAELLLRVQTDDALAQCPLSNKFGAAPSDCGHLLSRASALGLKVVGVSFHVGSGCSQPGAFRGALKRAKAVFLEAERQGFQLTLLDIGGGFPGWDEEGQATFEDHARDICELLEELFPSPDIRVIAEPGRFFVAKAQAMLTAVVNVAEASTGHRYYLNDGLYGSFNCLLYDHATVPRPTVLRDGHELSGDETSAASCGPCTVFGPTCDGFDVVSESMELPRLQVEDRLLFPNMGAYTSAASTSFNGFAPAATFIYHSETNETA